MLPKIRGTLCGGPYNEDSFYLGYYIRVPSFRKLLCNAMTPRSVQDPKGSSGSAQRLLFSYRPLGVSSRCLNT